MTVKDILYDASTNLIESRVREKQSMNSNWLRVFDVPLILVGKMVSFSNIVPSR